MLNEKDPFLCRALSARCLLGVLLALCLALPGRADATLPYRPLLTPDLLGAFRGQWDWQQPLGQELALHVPVHFLASLPAGLSPNATVQVVAILGDPERPDDQSHAIDKPLGQPVSVGSLRAGGDDTGSLAEPYVRAAFHLTALNSSRLLHLQLENLWLGPASDRFLAGLSLAVTSLGKSVPQSVSLDLVPSVAGDMTALVRTDRVGNVFVGAEPCRLELAAFRLGGQPRTVPVVVTVTDFLTHQKQFFPTPIAVTKSAAQYKTLVLPLHRYGIFTASVSAGGQELASTRITRVAAPRAVSDASPFGINLFQEQNWSYTFDLPLMAKAGVKWIRPWLEWENNAVRQEPAPGQWDWKLLDATLKRCGDLSLSYAYLFWTSGPMAATSAPGPTTWWTDDAAQNQGWTDYAKTIVGRYKDRIHVWEYWNEPYSFTTGAKYLPLVRALDAGVKAVAPAATRIGMGGTVAPDFTQGFVGSGGLAYCNAVSCHLYSQAMPPGTAPEDFIPQELDAQEALMVSAGKPRVPIWLNEVSYSADSFDPTYGKTIGTSELTQAQFLVRTYLLALSKQYVDKVLWFCTLDPRDPKADAVDASVGVTYLDHTPKLAYAALSALCGQMGVPHLIGRLDVPSPGRAYAWNVAGKVVVTAWSAGDPIHLQLPTDGQKTQCVDMMGNPLTVTKTNETIDVALSGSPVYLHGLSFGDVQRLLVTDTVKAGAPDAFASHDFFGYPFTTNPGIVLQPNTPASASVHLTNLTKAHTLSVRLEGTKDVQVTPAQGSVAVEPGKDAVFDFQLTSAQSLIVEPIVVQARDGLVRIRLHSCPVVFDAQFTTASETDVHKTWTPTGDFYDTLSWLAPGFHWGAAEGRSHNTLRLDANVPAWTGFKSAPIAVKPNTTYMLSYADKTDSTAPGGNVWSFIISEELKHQAYPTTVTQTSHSDWGWDQSVFRTTANAKFITIKLQKNDKIQGTVWFDDIRLVELTPARD